MEKTRYFNEEKPILTALTNKCKHLNTFLVEDIMQTNVFVGYAPITNIFAWICTAFAHLITGSVTKKAVFIP